MKKPLTEILEEKGLRYRYLDFCNHPIVGGEVVKFAFLSPKFKGHALKHLGEIYFDEFIMDEIKDRVEKRAGGFIL